MFIVTTGWIIDKGSREDLTSSSKILFDIFLKLFDIRNDTTLKPKVFHFKSNLTLDSQEPRRTSDSSFLEIGHEVEWHHVPAVFRHSPWLDLPKCRRWSKNWPPNLILYLYERIFGNFAGRPFPMPCINRKTVVTAYYGIILDDTVNLLNEFQNGNLKSKGLWTSMIQSLHKSFTHDLDQDCASLIEFIWF